MILQTSQHDGVFQSAGREMRNGWFPSLCVVSKPLSIELLKAMETFINEAIPVEGRLLIHVWTKGTESAQYRNVVRYMAMHRVERPMNHATSDHLHVGFRPLSATPPSIDLQVVSVFGD